MRGLLSHPSTAQQTGRFNWRGLARWSASFLAFPLAGAAGTAIAGPVDDAWSALLGGTIAGAVIGAGQALLSSGRLNPRLWTAATAVGNGTGLMAGSSLVGYATSLGQLAVAGAVTGVALGLAQAAALPVGPRRLRRWAWALAMPALWALGWTVTTLGGIHVEEQFTNFGAYGAITVTVLTGLLLEAVLPLKSRPITATKEVSR
jgi:hypothetical protein